MTSPEAQPATHSFVADLDVSSVLVDERRCLMAAPLTPGVASPAGSAAVGVLVTLVDVGSSDPALVACRPDWTATQDLSIHATGWLTDGPMVVDNHLVRVGKKVVVVASEVYDGHGVDDLDDLQRAIDGPAGDRRPTLVARCLLTFARIPGSAASGVEGYDPAQWLGQVRRRVAGHPAVGTLHERMGLRVVDPTAGVVELDRTPYVANSIGTINGGAQAIAIQAAAEAMCPGLVATDLQIHFLSQVRAGPARTYGDVSRHGPDHSVVTVRLVDAGHQDQLLALATATLQRPPT